MYVLYAIQQSRQAYLALMLCMKLTPDGRCMRHNWSAFQSWMLLTDFITADAGYSDSVHDYHYCLCHNVMTDAWYTDVTLS